MSVSTLPSVPEAAASRRSIRAYTPEPVPAADLEIILGEAAMAPSAFNLQPWRFVVVKDEATKRRLAEAAYHQRQVTAAPAVIVLYTDMADTLEHLDELVRPGSDARQLEGFRATVMGSFAGKDPAEREAWGYAQGFIALGYLLLSAEARGYATSPMGGFQPEAVKQLLGLPAHVRIPALVAIGRGAEEGAPRHRHGLERIARVV
jgi:nitroreductase